MKEEQKINQNEMLSLNEKLVSEYSIQELEKRLETDPLFFINDFDDHESPLGIEGVDPACEFNCFTMCFTCSGSFL